MQPLKLPELENFHLTDFRYFFTTKPLWVGDFRAEKKIQNKIFFVLGILYTGNFSGKNLVFAFLSVH